MSTNIQTHFKTKFIEEEFKTNSFLFQFENKIYTITTHHFLPFKEDEIYSIYNKIKIKHNIITRPIWNEILILDYNDSIKHNIIKNYKKIKPLEKEKLYIGFEKIESIMVGIKYITLGFIPGNPRLLYYTVNSETEINLKGYSGSPVFDNNDKLIGIFCKKNRNQYYILPIIYLIKTLEKKDNNNIYWIEQNIKNIKKINNFNIKNNQIYYKVFNNIPTDIFLLLEGDIDNTLLIKEIKDSKDSKDSKEKIETIQIKFTNITDKLNFNLSNDINFNNITKNIIVNIAFLELLKHNKLGSKARNLIEQSIKLININEILT